MPTDLFSINRNEYDVWGTINMSYISNLLTKTIPLNSKDIRRHETKRYTRFINNGTQFIPIPLTFQTVFHQVYEDMLAPTIRTCEATKVTLEKVKQVTQHFFDSQTGKYKGSTISTYINGLWDSETREKFDYVKDITDLEFLSMLKSS